MFRKIPKIICMLRKIFIINVKSSNVIIGSIVKVIFCEVRVVLSAIDISSTSLFLMLFRKNMKGGSFVAGDSSCPDALRYRRLPACSFPPTFLSPSQPGIIHSLKSLMLFNFRQDGIYERKISVKLSNYYNNFLYHNVS